MKRIVVFGALFFVLPTSAAHAQTTVVEPIGSHFPYQHWIEESQVPTPDVTVEVIEAPPGYGCVPDPGPFGYLACTDVAERKIWIAATQLIGEYPRETFMHEIGHYFAEELPEWGRERFDSIYGLGGPWVGEPGQLTPEEWFAEAYSECAAKPYITLREWTALGDGPVYGGRPIFEMRVAHNKVCRMIQNL